MHDLRTLLDPATRAGARLARRRHPLDPETLGRLAARRAGATEAVDALRAEARSLATGVREAAPDERAALVARARERKADLQAAEEHRRRCAEELRELLLTIPNLPADDAPDGVSGDDAVEVRRWGTPAELPFTPADHVTLGERCGILDFGRAAKLAGSRFAVLSGAGAILERALAQFFLHLHTTRHGYTEYSLPVLVNRASLTGTGQLPKFEEDLFRTEVAGRELFLIPTAEVPLTNLYADEIVPASALPLALTGYTPCFRGEAGSYGRDTRGLIRLHQFAKVELVRICAAERARGELELMTGHAEACLRELGLPYRVVALAAGDLGFAAEYTYDLEVWLPGQQCFREISSCSSTGTFQARRAAIRTRANDGSKSFAATLNGSGLPIGRTVVALLENGQRADGSVHLPEALVPFTGFAVIRPDGTTSH